MSRILGVLAFVAFALSACSSSNDGPRGRAPGTHHAGPGGRDPRVPVPDAASGGGMDARPDAGAADADVDASYSTAFSFAWTIEDVGPPTNDVVSCEEAGTKVVTVAATNTATGIVYNFSFPCGNQSGVQLPLPPGPYSLAVALRRSNDLEVSSIVIPMQLSATGVTDIGGVIFEIQSFSASWTIARKAAPNVAVSCASVNAANVEFTATKADLAPFVFQFPCADGKGLTEAVPYGTYALQFRLLNTAGSPLSQFTNASYSTPAGSRAVLPTLAFTVD